MMEAGSDRGLLVQKPSEKLKIKMCNTHFPQKSRAPRPIPFPLVLSSEKNGAAENIVEVRRRTWLLIVVEHPGIGV